MWSVSPPNPHMPERRQVPDRRRVYIPDFRPERRTIADRRAPHGWLCFETDSERKRLAPVPPNWKHLPKEQMEKLCEQAHPVRRSG